MCETQSVFLLLFLGSVALTIKFVQLMGVCVCVCV